jgi:DNA-binding NtrC family response regulator
MSLASLLIVDDERGVRESLKMVFAKEYRLLEAESIDAAMPRVLEEKPQIVLLDVLMPKTDGIEALKQIKAIHPDCAVIMLTGLNSQQLASKAMEFGAFDFIGKPFDVMELRQKVSNALKAVTQRTRPQ